MKKLALSAGHYLGTPGKRCLKSLDKNETKEWVLNDRIADKIEKKLAAYDDIEILRLDDTTGKKEVLLSTRSNQSNKWGADFYLAIHHNAGVNGGSGGGIVAYRYNGSVSAATKQWQKDLYNELIKLTGLKGNRSTPLAASNLHECREPNAPAVLLELGFMDSKTDVPIILTENFAEQCATACANVIVKTWGLKKRATSSSTTTTKPTTTTTKNESTTTTTIVKTYKVVTDINKYASADDAKAKKNSKGKLTAGTYYIYTKYPTGVNGMYNISTDKTGKSAGSWINPAENVVKTTTAPTTTETVEKIYRVRKDWNDAASQVGAFKELENAKDACQKAGVGYEVYDWNGKVVYTYTKPSTTTTATSKKKAVYDLDYPVKTKIVDKSKGCSNSQLNQDCVRAIKKIIANNKDFDINIAKAFFKLAPKYGIDPMMAIAQSILETGWFKYSGSAVKAEQHNYCGLAVTSNGVTGASFATIEDGVTAQLQHLYAYGTKDTLPSQEKILDPRFNLVTRGIATYWQQLAGRWAVPGFDGNDAEAAMKAGTTYGQKILSICEQLRAVKITEDEVKKYFGQESSPVETPEKDTTTSEENKQETSGEVEEEKIDTKKVNTILNLLEKVLNFIIGLFTKK